MPAASQANAGNLALRRAPWNRPFLEELQDFPHGVVKIHSQPEGAEVTCDGRNLGLGPLEVALLPGPHDISARWNGHDDQHHDRRQRRHAQRVLKEIEQ